MEAVPSAGANAVVYSLALQSDGKILVGGIFTNVAGQACSRLGRLNNAAPATQELTFDGFTISWLRGGSGPEAWRTSFEASTNGTDWQGLGSGARVPGGWQLPEVCLATNATIRARGYVSGGQYNGSAWFVESTLAVDPQTPPSIRAEEESFGIISNQFGFNVGGLAGQVVVVEGSSNLLHWTALSTNTLGSGPLYFSDPAWTEMPWRFYRVRLWP